MKIYIAITYALFAALWLSTATSADEFDRERRSIFEDGGVPEGEGLAIQSGLNRGGPGGGGESQADEE